MTREDMEKLAHDLFHQLEDKINNINNFWEIRELSYKQGYVNCLRTILHKFYPSEEMYKFIEEELNNIKEDL